MIKIGRENETVSINFETDLPFNCEGTKTAIYHFKHTFHNTEEAELFRRYFTKRLYGKIERTKSEAYESGWKDKSSKRRKETYFGGSL